LTGVTVVHAIPGRIRLKIAQIRNDHPLADEVEDRLSRIAGVRSVETNSVTGSVLILFKEPSETPDDALQYLTATWPSELGPLEYAAPHAGNGHGNGNGDGSKALANMDRRVVELVGSVNAGVSRVASGVDLKLIVPFGLFLLGARSLFFSEKVVAPAWYDFFWFGLSIFMMVNRSTIEADSRSTSSAAPA
jgi:hypothetical protein